MCEKSIDVHIFLLVLLLTMLFTLAVSIGATYLIMKKQIKKYRQELERNHQVTCSSSKYTSKYVRDSLPGLPRGGSCSTCDESTLRSTSTEKTIACDAQMNDCCEDIFESVVVYDQPESYSTDNSCGQQFTNDVTEYEDMNSSVLNTKPNAFHVHKHFHPQNHVMLPKPKPIVPPNASHYCNIALAHAHVYDCVLPTSGQRNYNA